MTLDASNLWDPIDRDELHHGGNAGLADERQRKRHPGLAGDQARVTPLLLLREKRAVLETGGQRISDDDETGQIGRDGQRCAEASTGQEPDREPQPARTPSCEFLESSRHAHPDASTPFLPPSQATRLVVTARWRRPF